MKDAAIDLLKRLTEAHGAPSTEAQVRHIFATEIGGECATDQVGSVICTITGTSDGPRVMFESHMDEVGFAVQRITRDGFVKFTPLGGWWGHTLLAQRVCILTRSGNRILGLITSKPTHFLNETERKTVQTPENMYIDIGATSGQDVAERFGVEVGDTIVPESSFTRMHDPDLLMAKAFDNRAGTALVIQALQQLCGKPHPNTLIGVGAVQEEVGTRGAETATRVVQPDVAIVLEGAPADDAPGVSADEMQGALGKGPQIRLMDPTAIMNRPLALWVIALARELGIPHQVAVRTSGGTDAKPIHLSGAGVPTVVIGVPARYIHTHNSIIDIRDYLHALQLLIAIGERLDAETVAGFTRYL